MQRIIKLENDLAYIMHYRKLVRNYVLFVGFFDNALICAYVLDEIESASKSTLQLIQL